MDDENKDVVVEEGAEEVAPVVPAEEVPAVPAEGSEEEAVA